MRGLSLVAASRGHSSSRCAGLSLSRPLLLQSTGSRRAGSVVVAHGLSCSAACGIFPDHGSNPCPLHWRAASQPLRHQESPRKHIFETQLHLTCVVCVRVCVCMRVWFFLYKPSLANQLLQLWHECWCLDTAHSAHRVWWGKTVPLQKEMLWVKAEPSADP